MKFILVFFLFLAGDAEQLAERMYGRGACPHLAQVNTAGPPHHDDVGWYRKDGQLRELRSYNVCAIIFWADYLCVNRYRPVVDGPERYPYKVQYAEAIAGLQEECRQAGIAVIGYINGYQMDVAGFGIVDVIREMRRHRWDGVVFDSLLGSNDIAKLANLKILRLHLPHAIIIEHRNRQYGPESRERDHLVDYIMVGELVGPFDTGANGELVDPRWYTVASSLGTSDTLRIHKVRSGPAGNDQRASFKKWWPRLTWSTIRLFPGMWDRWRNYLWTPWRERQIQYLEDPDGFVRAEIEEMVTP